MNLVMQWVTAVAIVLISNPLLAQGAAERDDSIKYACLVTGELGNEVDEAWCQCQNDYFNELLTDADWETYTNDYYALTARMNDQRSTPPNSYARAVKLGNVHCRTCKQNDYKGCLSDDGATPSTGAFDRLLADLRDGQFDAIDNTNLFKSFFVHYVTGYYTFCANQVVDPVDRSVVWREWLVSDFSRVQTDEQVNVMKVARRLVGAYDQYSTQVSNSMAQDWGRELLEARERLELPTKWFQSAVNQIVEPRVFMQNHLQGRCDARDVSAAYENLYRFSQGQDPLVVPEFQAERLRKAEYRERRKAEVRAAVLESRDRAAARYAAAQAREAQLPPKSFACDAAYRESRAAATVVNRRGADFQTLVGGWSGTFNGKPFELATWSDRFGVSVTGYGYFPDYDCLFKATWESPHGVSMQERVALLRLRAYQQNLRPDNCAAMVRDDRDGEIHFFGAQGFVTLGSDMNDFVWTVSSGKLSQHSPMGCDDVAVTMSRGGVSDDFKAVMRQHPGTERNATPIPTGFIDSL
ncbi:MAG: hypothetical protein AAFN07_07405 [Pseudomonadota bacterium]